MSLPSITVPGALRFLAADYSVEEDDVFGHPSQGQGPTRIRRVRTVAQRRVNVSWLLTQEQMTVIDAWFEDTLQAGQESFAVEIKTQGPGSLWYSAKWSEAYHSEPMNSARGTLWHVTGQMVLDGAGENTGPTDANLAVEFVALLEGAALSIIPIAFAVEFSAGLRVAASLRAEFVAHLASATTVALPLAVEFSAALEGEVVSGTGVVSVGLALPATVFSITGSPVISAGTLTATFVVQNANKVFAGPTTGADATPAFRALVKADLPTLSAMIDAEFGNTQGQILTRNGTVWTVLNPGTAGYVLSTNGAGANVSWIAAAAGGTSSTKVTASAVSLGTQSANQTSFTYTTVPSIATRGLVSRMLITFSVAGIVDLVVRGAGSSGGTLYLQALTVKAATYEVTLPWYYENDAAAQDFFVGWRNAGPTSVTATLTALRVERFA